MGPTVCSALDRRIDLDQAVAATGGPAQMRFVLLRPLYT
jgi:hypothetical protein